MIEFGTFNERRTSGVVPCYVRVCQRTDVSMYVSAGQCKTQTAVAGTGGEMGVQNESKMKTPVYRPFKYISTVLAPCIIDFLTGNSVIWTNHIGSLQRYGYLA